MRKLSSREKLHVMREAAKRYGNDTLRTMTRTQYNDVLRTIAIELYPQRKA